MPVRGEWRGHVGQTSLGTYYRSTQRAGLNVGTANGWAKRVDGPGVSAGGSVTGRVSATGGQSRGNDTSEALAVGRGGDGGEGEPQPVWGRCRVDG